MCAFATVHNVESPQEWWSRQLKLKLADAKSEQEQIAALHAHIDELTKYLDRQEQDHFRIVNLMSKKELDAYDMIADKLKPHASNMEWLIEIREWQKNNL